MEVASRIDDEVIVLYDFECIAHIKGLEVSLYNNIGIHSLELGLGGSDFGAIEERSLIQDLVLQILYINRIKVDEPYPAHARGG